MLRWLLLAGVGLGTAKWHTRPDAQGRFQFFNDEKGDQPQQLKGVSMTGFETGSRGTQSGGGFWLFDPGQNAQQLSKQVIQNVITTLIKTWNADAIRIPICGSGWLQNYNVQDWGKNKISSYQEWVDVAIETATNLGAVVVLDNHLWAIAPQTNSTRNAGLEDGCTGINKVCVGVPSCIDSCAPHDWYGQYTSQRTGKTYNQGDDINNWQCAIANADGCTLDSIKRHGNAEHFFNLWYDLANHYKNNDKVWFELFNEPYQRKAAQFNDPACKQLEEGTAFVCPPGHGFGDNLDESQYDWAFWSELVNITVGIIRGQGADNVILVGGLDWAYDYLGKGGSASGGPIARPELLPWTKWAKNVGYTLHPYQHGACCGAIGSDSDQSENDPFESAFCMYPPTDGSGQPVASRSPLPIPESVSAGSKICDTTGYTTTQNKKSPTCIWKAQAKGPNGNMGVCAGDKDTCATLNQQQCQAVDDSQPSAGGWSRYVLPMQKYGPLMATEFGTFDCSSAYTKAFLSWAKRHSVSYSAWAVWPQNSGGPGAGACGYPSVTIPTGGALDASCGFGKCNPNCQTADGCAQIIKAMPWSGQAIYDDMNGNAPSPGPGPAPPSPSCPSTICVSDSECGPSCHCHNNICS
eukprot:TRINITY_DN1400_c0_g1_i1.p1 TRINITY_DN1400_c0_g1~~TRINITY_DN1400_c0_g1_i1.p1  ORF type:complete len:635 (-),score=70.88 TRINITY_DN1400_c0_g1_i1:44-1948(-)